MTEGPRRETDGSLPQTFPLPTRPNPATTPSTENISAGLPSIDPSILPNGTGPPSDPTLLGAGLGGGMEPNSEEFSWEMIGLGLEEPLPLQDTVNDL